MAALETRYKGMLFVAPWVIGFSVFTLFPFLSSIYYSFTDFNVLEKPIWVGAENFKEMAGDAVFWHVLKNTFLYAALAIPAGLCVSLGLALCMNAVRRGQIVYSVIFYLPFLVPPTAAAILWMWIFNAEFGLLNAVLGPILQMFNPHWAPPAWLTDSAWAIEALVIICLWGIGQSAFIYLAKLQDVPQDLYEAAEIDGASMLQKIWHVTLPMISPVIFFNIIMGIIGSFQIFTEPYQVFGVDGGPARCAYFLPHYIFDHAFTYLRMGYACAMSWILFMIILLLTLLAFRLSKDRVYYAGK